MASIANRIPAYIMLLLILLIFSYLALTYKPTIIKRYPSPHTPIGDAIIGRETASFLWSYRWLDILILGLLLLIAAVSCVALLRRS
jgi:NADH:ubiquinone oxidoreductase subunit 6 (subunit J)